MKNFLMSIVNVNDPPNGNTQIHPYSINKRGHLHKQQIAIARDYYKLKPPSTSERFDRIKDLYPLDALSKKIVVLIGLGGSRQFAEDLARSGVVNFALFDGDTVSRANIATQHVYSSEVGRNKAEVIKERILDINPLVRVTVVPRFLNESMTDNDFMYIIGKSIIATPEDVLICGCTDNFYAQARSAALALKFGTPYIAAQLYRGGMAAEIYFSYPGATNNSCPRCAMRNRYEAYANGYKSDVTSAGTPIFATTRVNSLKGQIALMLLLYKEDKNCIYSNMLDQVADRNFVMIRMSPLAGSSLNINIFNEALCEKSGLTYFDETVWIPQAPSDGTDGHDVCPLCNGTGDLLALKGRIADTRTDW